MYVFNQANTRDKYVRKKVTKPYIAFVNVRIVKSSRINHIQDATNTKTRTVIMQHTHTRTHTHTTHTYIHTYIRARKLSHNYEKRI